MHYKDAKKEEVFGPSMFISFCLLCLFAPFYALVGEKISGKAVLHMSTKFEVKYEN